MNITNVYFYYLLETWITHASYHDEKIIKQGMHSLIYSYQI